MSTIFDVANYILSEMGNMTTMKLQKMCYYAQAWNLVWEEIPLFDNEFYAWGNGPVNNELFHKYKGIFMIDTKGEKLEYNLTPEQIETIDSVIEFYGHRSGKYLSDLTHLENPWKNARQNYKANSNRNVIITKESIQDYYSSL